MSAKLLFKTSESGPETLIEVDGHRMAKGHCELGTMHPQTALFIVIPRYQNGSEQCPAWVVGVSPESFSR